MKNMRKFDFRIHSKTRISYFLSHFGFTDKKICFIVAGHVYIVYFQTLLVRKLNFVRVIRL